MLASDTPIVCFYYAFIGIRSTKHVTKDAGVKEDEDMNVEDEKDETGTMTTALVGRDAKSRVCRARPVPRKGRDVEELSPREGRRLLDFLRYKSLLFNEKVVGRYHGRFTDTPNLEYLDDCPRWRPLNRIIGLDGVSTVNVLPVLCCCPWARGRPYDKIRTSNHQTTKPG